jgi:acetylglutamate kinase
MNQQLTVIKVGGNELDDPTFLEGLVSALAAFAQRLVLVHGGGKEISAALALYGQEVRFIEGLRVTTPESMAVMEMVVSGRINRRLVAKLVSAGRQALGVSGIDLGLMRCVPHRPNGVDLGRVGEVTTVDTAALEMLLAPGWLPVIAPVALGSEDGLPYNINADHAALAVAAALSRANGTSGAVELVFVSNVPGVLLDGQAVELLSAVEIEQHIQAGAISGGMIPKIRSALAAFDSGVASVRITSLPGLQTGGTRIRK